MENIDAPRQGMVNTPEAAPVLSPETRRIEAFKSFNYGFGVLENEANAMMAKKETGQDILPDEKAIIGDYIMTQRGIAELTLREDSRSLPNALPEDTFNSHFKHPGTNREYSQIEGVPVDTIIRSLQRQIEKAKNDRIGLPANSDEYHNKQKEIDTYQSHIVNLLENSETYEDLHNPSDDPEMFHARKEEEARRIHEDDRRDMKSPIADWLKAEEILGKDKDNPGTRREFLPISRIPSRQTFDMDTTPAETPVVVDTFPGIHVEGGNGDSPGGARDKTDETGIAGPNGSTPYDVEKATLTKPSEGGTGGFSEFMRKSGLENGDKEAETAKVEEPVFPKEEVAKEAEKGDDVKGELANRQVPEQTEEFNRLKMPSSPGAGALTEGITGEVEPETKLGPGDLTGRTIDAGDILEGTARYNNRLIDLPGKTEVERRMTSTRGSGWFGRVARGAAALATAARTYGADPILVKPQITPEDLSPKPPIVRDRGDMARPGDYFVPMPEVRGPSQQYGPEPVSGPVAQPEPAIEPPLSSPTQPYEEPKAGEFETPQPPTSGDKPEKSGDKPEYSTERIKDKFKPGDTLNDIAIAEVLKAQGKQVEKVGTEERTAVPDDVRRVAMLRLAAENGIARPDVISAGGEYSHLSQNQIQEILEVYKANPNDPVFIPGRGSAGFKNDVEVTDAMKVVSERFKAKDTRGQQSQ